MLLCVFFMCFWPFVCSSFFSGLICFTCCRVGSRVCLAIKCSATHSTPSLQVHSQCILSGDLLLDCGGWGRNPLFLFRITAAPPRPNCPGRGRGCLSNLINLLSFHSFFFLFLFYCLVIFLSHFSFFSPSSYFY